MHATVQHLQLVSRPCHHTTIDIATDDGDAEAARCDCGAEWHQTDGPLSFEWYLTHTPPQAVRT